MNEAPRQILNSATLANAYAPDPSHVSIACLAWLAATLYERDWRRIRVAVPTFAAMAVLQCVALARYSDTVDWGDAKLWIYLAYLASLFVLGNVPPSNIFTAA